MTQIVELEIQNIDRTAVTKKGQGHILQRHLHDEDEEVRDWATFGVGCPGDTDSDEVRAALARALTDTYQKLERGSGRISKKGRHKNTAPNCLKR